MLARDRDKRHSKRDSNRVTKIEIETGKIFDLSSLNRYNVYVELIINFNFLKAKEPGIVGYLTIDNVYIDGSPSCQIDR